MSSFPSYLGNVRQVHLETVDSSLLWCLDHKDEVENMLENPDRLLLVSCDRQLRGVGRKTGRSRKTWIHSPENLAITFVYKLDKKDEAMLSFIPLTVALCVVEALELKHRNLNVKIKWPNDLIVKNKKIAGIVVEVLQRKSCFLAVMGIGINTFVTPPDFQFLKSGSLNLVLPPTCVREALDKLEDENFEWKVLPEYPFIKRYNSCLTTMVSRNILQFMYQLQQNGFEGIRTMIEPKLLGLGQDVVVHVEDSESWPALQCEVKKGNSITGTLTGLSPSNGNLILRRFQELTQVIDGHLFLVT